MKKLKKIIQQILSIKIVRYLSRKTSLLVATIVSSSYLLSVPYYWLFFPGFMREQRAVSAGKKRYYKNLYLNSQPTRVALRRNIHRLEKALSMRPRRANFAQNFIMETVELFKESAEQWQTDNNSYDEGELIWAHNVLRDYFSAITQPTDIITKAQKLFEAQTYTPPKLDKIPFKRKSRTNLPSYDQMLALSQYRRSVRWFLPKKVDRQDIDDALMVARQSPTACNRLPYEFRIFDDPELVKRVANTPFGTAGYADNIPVIAVLVGKLGSYFSNRDRHAIYVDSALAAMSFAFALETKGLSTCMINWPDFEPLESKMQKLLNLGFDDRPVMLIAIGYADPEGLIPYSQKKSLDNIRSYNKI